MASLSAFQKDFIRWLQPIVLYDCPIKTNADMKSAMPEGLTPRLMAAG